MRSTDPLDQTVFNLWPNLVSTNGIPLKQNLPQVKADASWRVPTCRTQRELAQNYWTARIGARLRDRGLADEEKFGTQKESFWGRSEL